MADILSRFSKAFDTVDHSILCTKLTYYGFRGSSYDLLSDYLSGRQQRVMFHGDLFNWGISVPQGSSLTLCFLYYNDLSSIAKYCMYVYWTSMPMMLSCIVVIQICIWWRHFTIRFEFCVYGLAS